MVNKMKLTKAQKKKKINIAELKKLAYRIRRYLEEEGKITKNENNNPSGIFYSN